MTSLRVVESLKKSRKSELKTTCEAVLVDHIDHEHATTGERAVSERFQRERLLKQGRDVETWLARDQATGVPVVVKTSKLQADSVAWTSRLEHESTVLARIDCDAVVKFVAQFRDQAGTHVALKYVDG